MAFNDKVYRETYFYKQLCSELLLFVARADVDCWLTTNQKNTFILLREEFLHHCLSELGRIFFVILPVRVQPVHEISGLVHQFNLTLEEFETALFSVL